VPGVPRDRLGPLHYSLAAAVGHEPTRRERAPRGAAPLAPRPPLALRPPLARIECGPLFPTPLARRAALDAGAAIIELTTLAADAAVGQGFVRDRALSR
jgi:hypothetical protein